MGIGQLLLLGKFNVGHGGFVVLLWLVILKVKYVAIKTFYGCNSSFLMVGGKVLSCVEPMLLHDPFSFASILVTVPTSKVDLITDPNLFETDLPFVGV